MSASEDILEAAKTGAIARVRELLSADRSLAHAKDRYAKTPLHIAAEHNHRAVAEALLDAGAEVEAETCWGMTPLAWAANMNGTGVAEALFARGAKSNLWIAAALGLRDTVESYWTGPRMLKQGAGRSRCEEQNGNWVRLPPQEDYDEILSDAFYIACRNGHTDVARMLLDRGADINFRGFFGGTALHWAAGNGHRETVEFLLERGAQTDLRDEEFQATPAGWAKEFGHTEIVDRIGRAIS